MAESGKRMEQLKSYLRRLSEGESLDSVRVDFMREFKEVDAVEIMEAEQQMIKEGMPITEVQKLCDIHSTLFHGATLEEKIANARQPVDVASLREERAEKTRKLVETTGHPLFTLTQENEALEKLIARIREQLDRKVTEAAGTGTAVNGSNNTGENAVSRELLSEIRELAIHYAKKGDLLYPLLKVKYEISGPSDVMWTTDDEIRDEFSSLAKAKRQDEAWKQRMERALTRAEEMIYKEANILFPNCAVHFTEEEWAGIYQDAKDYDICLSVEPKSWERAEKILQERTAYFQKERSIQEGGTEEKGSAWQNKPGTAGIRKKSDGEEIVMAGGQLTVEELEAMLNTIPMEITFVDVENKNRFFNEGHKVFKRPAMALGREVFSCHPPKVEQQVRRIIEAFRAGTLDEVPVWMNKNGRIMLVKYMAVRDRNGQYVGTLELVQDMEFAREYFEGR